jgi:hypothetical protein
VNVDPSGTINGKSFTTPIEFRAILAERQGDFRIAVVRKLLSYALGRGIQASDRQTIEQIAAAVEADGDKFSSLILNIAKSYPFQFARGPVASDLAAVPATATGDQSLYHPVRLGGIPDSLQAPPEVRQQQQVTCVVAVVPGQAQAVAPDQGQAPPQAVAPAQAQGQAPASTRAQCVGQQAPNGNQIQGQEVGQAPNVGAVPAQTPAPAQTPVQNPGQTSNPLPGNVRAATVDNNREERL